jgi:hypothetical protein
MNTVIRGIALAAVAITTALYACHRDRAADRPSPSPSEPGITTITGASLVQNATAVSRIADVRCSRELACSRIGVGEKYSSHDSCVHDIRRSMQDDLDANDCPRGIVQKELDECLAAIKAESCNNPIERIERLTACRTSDLCRK